MCDSSYIAPAIAAVAGTAAGTLLSAATAKTPDIPSPQAPPAPPKAVTEKDVTAKAAEARDTQREKIRKARGAASTILTSGRGLGASQTEQTMLGATYGNQS